MPAILLLLPASCDPRILTSFTVIKLDKKLTPTDLLPKLERFWARSAECIEAVERSCPPGVGVAGVHGQGPVHGSKGWTEWTQGFQYGSALLQFDATGDERFLELGRERTLAVMAPHLTHVGVHDHGFNNVSTYGNLWRLMNEGRVAGRRLGAAISTSWRSR